MRRRLLLVLALGLCAAMRGATQSAGEPFNVLVPVDWTGEPLETQVKELRKMYVRYGLRKFVLIGPWHTQYERDLPLTEWERLGDSIAYAKKELADLDVEIGWWVVPTLRGGRHRPFQHIMDCDGRETHASCPLDRRFGKDFSAKIAACVRRARPSVIFFEDDFTLSNHGGMNAMRGCFCPLHLAEYAKRTGHMRTAKEIAEMFRRPTAANASLRKAFAELSRDSLAGLAASVRAAIDMVDPSIRICLCQSGFADIDGDATEAVARAFAGMTRPMVRVFGASYFNENAPATLPGELAHAFWSAQHLGKDMELLHETDPYPHTRFCNSSLYLFSELAAAVMAGVTGSYYYCTQYSDDPMGDDGYAQRLVDERRRLEVVRDLRAAMRPCGVRAVYTPKEVYMFRETKKSATSGMLPVHAYFLGKMGFPMTTVEDSPVAMLIGNTPDALSDDEIRKILSGGVLVDAEAASSLSKRGFSSLMGCVAEEANGRLFFTHERILPAAGVVAAGRKVYNREMDTPPFIGWTQKKNMLAELKPEKEAEVWSEVCDYQGKSIAPATVFFRNRLGGRVAVLSRSLDARVHPSIYSSRKQELFHRLFDVLADGRPLDVTAPKTPSIWLIAARNDRELLVMAENLCGEPRNDVELRFSPEWHGGEVSMLAGDGSWRALGTASANFALQEEMLPPLAPQFIKVAKRRVVAVKPAGRAAFERGEEGAELKLNVIGADDVFTVPVETRLKPGAYDMPVPIAGRLPSGEEVVATNSVKIRIGPTFADRMPVVMWSGRDADPADVEPFGFTHLYCNFGFTNEQDAVRQAQDIISRYDSAIAAGMRMIHGVNVIYPAEGNRRKDFYRCMRDGTQPPRPRDVNQPEVSNPELLAYARRLVVAETEAVGYHPGFAGVLPCSEKRDHSYPSFNAEHLRYKAETGRDVPPEAKWKVLEYSIAKQRFPDGVVPVDDPLYAYYSWFWGGGDGWPDYVGGIAEEYRKSAGRYGDGSAIQRRRPFFSFWDPAVRCPPKWGSGGNVDAISQWVYAQPEPMNVAGPAEEVIAMSAGCPGQQPMVMTQLIGYRAQLAPTNITVSPLPEWVKRRPGASFPTIPADSLQEAVWSMLAKPVKGIMFHGWRTIFETGARTGYTYTSPGTAMKMKELLREIVAPLGPTLKDLGRDEPEVAVLESFATTAFGGPGSWGWFSSPIMFLQRARLDPRVVYEETIMRDGFGKTKILYAPQCEFLSGPAVEKIKAFQKAGGILVADKKLLPALRADVVVPVFAYRKPPKSDHTAEMDAITQVRVCDEARRLTEKSKADMLAAANTLRRTLKEKYAYEPKADSSNPEIVTYSRAWRGTPYVFALNDRRTFGDYVGQWGLTMEKGMPFAGNVTLNDQDGKVGVVYELSHGGEVPFRRLADGRVEVPLSYKTNDGRLLMFLKHRIADVEVKCSCGDSIAVTMTVRDETGAPVPARLPVEIRIFDAAGQELDGAGYACAEDGVCKLTICTNLNDPPGGYHVVCRDRASGIVVRCRFLVMPRCRRRGACAQGGKMVSYVHFLKGR